MDLQLSVEHHRAIREITKVVSGPIKDAKLAFDVVSRNSLRLFKFLNMGLYERVGDKIDRIGYLMAEPDPDDSSGALWPIPLNDESLTGRCILSGKVVHCRDTATEPSLSPRVREIISQAGMRSILLAPTWTRGVPSGTLGFSSSRPGGWSDEEVELHVTHTNLMSIALEAEHMARALERKSA